MSGIRGEAARSEKSARLGRYTRQHHHEVHRMRSVRRSLAGISFALAALLALPVAAAAQSGTVLHAAQAGKLLPGRVYFSGQSASTQLRNSGGVRFTDGTHMLAILVNTSGYSSTVQQKYQGYLLTDDALEFGDHHLVPGAYGFGFVKGEFVVLDIGNHELFHTSSMHSEKMHRPMPLQVLAGRSAGTYRLCDGRDCVTFSRAQ
jgi:hypothetical protein